MHSWKTHDQRGSISSVIEAQVFHCQQAVPRPISYACKLHNPSINHTLRAFLLNIRSGKLKNEISVITMTVLWGHIPVSWHDSECSKCGFQTLCQAPTPHGMTWTSDPCHSLISMLKNLHQMFSHSMEWTRMLLLSIIWWCFSNTWEHAVQVRTKQYKLTEK